MLFLYLLFLCGFIFGKGLFAYPSILIFVVVLFYYILYFKKGTSLYLQHISPQFLVFIVILLSLLVQGGLYFQTDLVLIVIATTVYGLCVWLASLFFIIRDEKKMLFLYIALVVVAVGLRVLTIALSPNPPIDVFDILKNGAIGLLHGKNPYTMLYTPLYKGVRPDYYSYPPGMLLLTVPFVAIFGDPRFTFVTAEVVISILVCKMVKKKPDRYLYSLLFLFNPNALIMTEQSFSDPLYLCLLFIMVVLLQNRKIILSAVVFGIALSGKQYVVFVFPLVVKLFEGFKRKIQLILISCTAAAGILLPFFLWNQKEFIREIVLFYIQFPARYNELTFFSFLNRFGIGFNPLLSLLIVSFGFVFVFLQKHITASRFFYLASFLYFVFFFFNKHAYTNYYYFIAQLLLLGCIFDVIQSQKEAVKKTIKEGKRYLRNV